MQGTIHGNLTGTASEATEATTVIGSTQSNITTLDNLTSIGHSTVSDGNTDTSTTNVKGNLQIDEIIALLLRQVAALMVSLQVQLMRLMVNLNL